MSRSVAILCALTVLCVGIVAFGVLRHQRTPDDRQRDVAIPAVTKRHPKQLRDNWMEDLVPLGKLADMIVFGDNGSAAIAGTGTILISNDGGHIWHALTEGQGDIRVTKDGGLTYEELQGGAGGISVNALCNVESAAIISRRLFLRSTCEHTVQIWSVPLNEGSDPWHIVSFTYDGDPARGVFAPGSDFLVAQNRILIEGSLPSNATILTSDDQGKSWRPFLKSSVFDNGLAAFDFHDENTGWVLTGAGDLVTTSDGGSSWKTISSIPQAQAQSAYSMTFVTTEKAFLVGANGLILVTNNGGQTWQPSKSNVEFNLFKVTAASTRHAWAIGSSDVVVETTDGGLTWQTVSLGLDRDVYRRLTVKDGTAWICSDRSLFRSQ